MTKTQFEERGGADALVYGEHGPTPDGTEQVISTTHLGAIYTAHVDDLFNAMLSELRSIRFLLSLLADVAPGINLEE